MKKLFLILLLLLVICCISYCQKGWIVTKSNDTIRCNVKHVTAYGVQYSMPSNVFKKDWKAYEKPTWTLGTKSYTYTKSFKFHHCIYQVSVVDRVITATRIRGLFLHKKCYKFVSKEIN